MKKEAANAQENYTNKTHRIGKISTLIAILLILMVPAVITVIYGKEVEIQIPNTVSAIITLSAIYGTVSVVEVVSFSPFLGSAGTYLSFITGNIMNMKLPAATNALRVNNVERGTDEGEVITTLAIGASSIVTTIILFLGMLFLGRLLVPVITGPALAPAFNNVTPALTGALAAPYFMKNKKLSIPTAIAGCLLYLILGYDFMSSGYSFFMLGFIVVSFLCYLLLYKTGIVKENVKR
ncbi:MAG: hypothetical protein HFG41_06870 [Coprococcus sp.]|nr:hypothetical protein [Coprococcus sp.]